MGIKSVSCLLFLTPVLAFGQAGTATITGAVSDPSGAAIEGAKVAVRDATTGFSRETVSNETGNYSLPGLRPASYDVSVESSGFRRHTTREFRVEVDQIARLDIRLELGQVTEQVEVTGTQQLLHTESATLGAVIDRKKIYELPLNGQSFVQLALLVPGVNTGQPGAGRGGGISIGGARSEQNAFQLDGVSNSDQWDSGISFTPSIAAIEEFKIEVNNYSAEFGKGAGGQINVVTKPGSNILHGALYEFHRNSAVQARNLFQRSPFFVNKEGKFIAPPLIRNEFGAALSGPVFKDRTFFFADYIGRRQVSTGVNRRTVPTSALRSGDFSGNLGAVVGTDAAGRTVRANQIYDARSSTLLPSGRYLRTPFENNQIPASRFDPVAARIIQRGLWPVPNAPGDPPDPRTGNPRFNYFDRRSSPSNADQFMVRIDHRLSDKDVIYGRHGLNDTDSFGTGNFPGNERLDNNRQQVSSLSYTRTLSPTQVNEFRFGYQRERPQSGGARILEGVNLVKELGIRGLPLAGPGAPNVGVTGFTDFNDGGESRRSDDAWQFIEMFSFSKGRHFFKGGFEFRRIHMDVLNNPANTRGDFSFSNAEWSGLEGFPATGNTFANFLLGLSRQKARRPGDHSSFLRASEYAGYFQDDFKATSKLTINYGVRYQLYIPPKETRDHISALAVNPFPGHFGEGGIYVCKDPAKCAGVNPSLPNLRLGITLNDLNLSRVAHFVLAGREVPRSLVEVEKHDFGPRVGIAYRLLPTTVIRTGYGIFFDTAPASYFQDSVENLPWIREDQQSLSADQFGLPPAEAFFGFLLDDPPIGSFTPGPNTYEPGFRNAYMQHWNFGIQRQLRNSFVAEIAYAGSKGTKLNRRENLNTREPRSPRAVLATGLHSQMRRLLPFAVFDNQLIVLDNWFTTSSTAFSNYHALLARFEKRYARGLTFLNSFTWSKTISDAQPFSGGDNDTGNRIQDIFNKRADKALAGHDHRYRLVSSFIWDLPIGSGRRWASGAGGVLNHLIGGWQANGIVTFQSGFPITVRRSGDPLGVGTNEAVRPDLVCNPNIPRGQKALSRFFRQDCFAATSDRFGSAGRATVQGPWVKGFDLGILKQLAVREQWKVNFRSEFFNFLNHPNWNQPGRDLGGSNFGEVTGAGGPRIIQFGLQVLW